MVTRITMLSIVILLPPPYLHPSVRAIADIPSAIVVTVPKIPHVSFNILLIFLISRVISLTHHLPIDIVIRSLCIGLNTPEPCFRIVLLRVAYVVVISTCYLILRNSLHNRSVLQSNLEKGSCIFVFNCLPFANFST